MEKPIKVLVTGPGCLEYEKMGFFHIESNLDLGNSEAKTYPQIVIFVIKLKT